MLAYWNDISFQNPEYFWLLLVLPLMLAYYIFRNKKLQGTFKISSVSSFGKTKFPYFRHTIILLRMLGLAALVFA
ncbi:MAG: BatA domain-containing protein, partial [Flavobacteriales bacterium]|nr:BatA domain-containing protein [Flavobacteriales bacterium]